MVHDAWWSCFIHAHVCSPAATPPPVSFSAFSHTFFIRSGEQVDDQALRRRTFSSSASMLGTTAHDLLRHAREELFSTPASLLVLVGLSTAPSASSWPLTSSHALLHELHICNELQRHPAVHHRPPPNLAVALLPFHLIPHHRQAAHGRNRLDVLHHGGSQGRGVPQPVGKEVGGAQEKGLGA